jgi:hypothetical protein
MSKSLREVERLLALAREHSGAKFGFAGDITAFCQELEELVAKWRKRAECNSKATSATDWLRLELTQFLNKISDLIGKESE